MAETSSIAQLSSNRGFFWCILLQGPGPTTGTGKISHERMDLYDKYNSLFLQTNATFLCERAFAEVRATDPERSAEALQALASCFLRQGAPKRAYSVLTQHQQLQGGRSQPPECRYLLAIACIKLDKPTEAEEALLPDRRLRSGGPSQHGAAIAAVAPHGAAGLYVLGVACQRMHRKEDAAEYFKLSLAEDPLMWVAFDALCELGVSVDPDDFFVDAETHSSKNEPLGIPPPSSPNTARRNIFPSTAETTPASAAVARRQRLASECKTVERTPFATAAKALAFDTTVDSSVESMSLDRPPTKVARVRDGESPAALTRSLLKVLTKLGRARAAMAHNLGGEALKALHAVPSRHFETGWVLHAVGRVHLEGSDYVEAVQAFRKMERLEPHRMQGLELLSTALWHLKDEVELCYLARRCVEFDPRSPEAWCATGNCLSLQKEHDGAIRCFQRAIAVDPRFAYAYTLCGHEYVANEDFDKAITMYRHAMRIDERHYNAWYGLGAIYYRQEKYELAEYHFERAIAYNPQSSVLHCYQGMTLHAAKKFDDALVYLRRATEMEPKNPQARFQCANVLISMDRYEEALAELKAVSDRAPREASVQFLMGKVCKKLGRTNQALMHLNFALDLEPKDNNIIKSAIDRLEEPDISEDEKF